MIPKIIHFCWLSNDPYPELITQCIKSWKNILPDYEFKLWNLSCPDIAGNKWVQQAFENKKYAFAADYVRFYALFNYGGIYLDADVEVLKSFNDLLDRHEFLGEECAGDIEAAVMGAEKGSLWVGECLNHYSGRSFVKEDGKFDMRPVPLLVNEVAKKYNLEIMPYTVFSPKNYHVGRIYANESSYTIHHFDGKWVKRGLKSNCKLFIHRMLYAFFGRKGHNKVVNLIRKL